MMQNPFDPTNTPAPASVPPLPPINNAPKENTVWETIKLILQALAIAIIIKTFVVQPFSIPSASMYPTLMVGDYLFVPKWSYGYGQHSFDLTLGNREDPIIRCCDFVEFPGRKVFSGMPQRGDVAVFKLPTDTSQDYIKRVIGLPGDRIQMKEGVLYINGEAVKKERIEDYNDPEFLSGGEASSVPQYVETLPNGVRYLVLDSDPESVADNTVEYQVPAHHYFMMGDNRDNSEDSRYLSAVGFVPIENFVGRADLIFFSLAPDVRPWELWKLPSSARWSWFPRRIK